jgi:hypothetical protein
MSCVNKLESISLGFGRNYIDIDLSKGKKIHVNTPKVALILIDLSNGA